MNDLKTKALEAHRVHKGKLEIHSKMPLENFNDLSICYTPGVAEPCKEIAKDKELSYEYTARGNMVAVISEGTAVLGLGDIGPYAAMPVMEGKAVLFKQFAGIDAIPLCLGTTDIEEVIKIVKALEPSFGGINLEDIKAPNCFEIESRLIEEMDIPVFHDDQHGTAIVCLAGLINALKVVGKSPENVRVVVSGAGAAGIAVTKLLLDYGFKDLILQDSQGLIFEGREDLNDYKAEIAKVTNPNKLKGELKEALVGADIFLGLARPNLLNRDDVKLMNKGAIVFAMSNPDPEIMPDEARAGGAAVIATGRSDFPNQINNVLAFPGVFKGVLSKRGRKITNEMKLAAAKALADFVKDPTADKIIPGVFEKGVADVVAKAVAELV